MPKEIYFKETKEKAVSRKDKYDDRQEKRNKAAAYQTNLAISRKNISKKQADVARREKFNRRTEKFKEQKKEKMQNAEIHKLNHGRLAKLSLEEKRVHLLKQQNEKRREQRIQAQAAAVGGGDDGEDWEDVDEHEKEVFATTGYFDVPNAEAHISSADQKILEKMEKKNAPEEAKAQGEMTLADMIMAKIQAGDYTDETGENKMQKEAKFDSSALDPKVLEAYKKVGVVLRAYKSGKLPKAFKIVPQLDNWEEMILLTSPGTWSPHSHFQATKMFAAQNEMKAQRFYNTILLPAVQDNIYQYKKLNYHLYMAVKKSMFKIGAFLKGFLLPLAENASTREAIIIGSILQKMSISVLHVAAALMKMTTYSYRLGNGYFMKVLLSKRYSLPTSVLDALVNYMCKTGMQTADNEDMDEMDDEYAEPADDVEEMPVMWHQTVLALVQCYKYYFSVDQRKKLNALCKVQFHHAITPEIQRELASSAAMGKSSL